ncbi:MAG TPA: PqqD family protein [Myxococcota bacterium]|nr:PqqD family protein [Myxococcota bacterium]
MTQESVLRRAPGVVARTIAGETILVPVRRRAQEMGLFTLNAVGTFVWRALDGTRSLQEIASAVAHAFEVDPDRALSDVSSFAADLERTGCATPAEEAVR